MRSKCTPLRTGGRFVKATLPAGARWGLDGGRMAGLRSLFRARDTRWAGLGPQSLDVAQHRMRLLASFESTAASLDLSLVLDVGCGEQPWRRRIEDAGGRYVGVDLRGYVAAPSPDAVWDGRCLPVRPGSATAVLLTEVLEHVPQPQALLREVHRVLAPGGCCYLTVPFLWPLHDSPFDEYRYTPFALRRLAADAGFEVAHLWHLGGWDASLARMIGLWVRRRPMNRWVRAALSFVLLPVVVALDRIDAIPTTDGDGMITASAAVLVRQSQVRPTPASVWQ